jgi:flagellin-like protein
MRKGISPVVSVVLLIAIAVIAAVGLYFWIGTMTGPQPSPSPPGMVTVVANKSDCSGDDSVIVSNSGASELAAGSKLCGQSIAGLESGNSTMIECSANPNDFITGTNTLLGEKVGSVTLECP